MRGPRGPDGETLDVRRSIWKRRLATTAAVAAAGFVVANGAASEAIPAARAVHAHAVGVPAGLESPDLQALWREGIELERRDQYLEAARVYERMSELAPQLGYPFWKVSRNYWRFAESLPGDAKAQRLPWFERADAWASRGLAVDPACAECMLWKFGAMGRIGTTRGVLSSLGMAPEMRDLLERAIALEPRYRDDASNSTLGNLHYAGAVFYRVVPESIWLDWLVGVRGDIARSLAMIRRAAEIDRDRIDYRVELGAVLLCYAERRRDDAARAEARAVLMQVPELPRQLSTDRIDLEHARTLLDRPSLACGYSRDGWIDLESEQRAAQN